MDKTTSIALEPGAVSIRPGLAESRFTSIPDVDLARLCGPPNDIGTLRYTTNEPAMNSQRKRGPRSNAGPV